MDTINYRCFLPTSLKYCVPDAQQELLGVIIDAVRVPLALGTAMKEGSK